ncbi:MAG: ATP-binding protein [Anaerolineaceae bacterium]|jgi:signal transduction histidine kinase/DNA-binding response OmpR family regulator
MPQPAQDHILIVENDPIISDLIARQALQSAGYQTQVTGDANSAIAQAIQQSPDVIIADLNLPGLSGKDLMVALSSQNIPIPIIVLTHKGNEADLVQAFRLGAADYLLWPVRETEVLNVVERVLKQVHEHSEREKLSHQLQQANQEMQLRVRELTTIFSIGKAVTSITDQPILFEKILEGATKATQADLGWFSLYDDTRKVFVLVGSRNLPPALGERLNQPWDDGIGSLVAMSGESLSIHGDSLKRFKIMALGQAALIVPVKVQKQVMALLTVIRRKADPFNASEQHLLEAVADYASISLVNARLFRVVEERARAQQILAENAQVGEKIKIEILLNVKDELRSTVEATRYALERMVKDPGARWTAEQRQAMVVMQDSVQNLGRIVEAISPLPLASSQAAGPVDLIDLVNKAVERSRRFAQQNELTLSFEAPLQPVPVLADAIQINQVLDGLLSNAIKFSLPGGHVTVRLEKMADGIAHVTVSDTGIGIDPHFADQIFGGISHPTVPRRFGGLGIRLNLIKEIVTHHKGKVWLESKTGQGAIFHFTLPTPKS